MEFFLYHVVGHKLSDDNAKYEKFDNSVRFIFMNLIKLYSTFFIRLNSKIFAAM